MGYRWLVTAILLVHGLYLLYVVLGGLLTWRWPRAFWPHLLAAGWGLAVVAVPLNCPLTWAADWARRRAGEGPAPQGFIDSYVQGVLYPARYTGLLQVLVGVVVVGSWAIGYLLWRRRRVRPAHRTAAGPGGTASGL